MSNTGFKKSAANPETPNSTISREANTQSSSAATSQGYVLPEGKIMPNTVFVGGIDVRMDETEIRGFFARYGSVKEVKIITDRTGVSKGHILLIQIHQFRLIQLLTTTVMKLIQEQKLCQMNAQFVKLLHPLEMAHKRQTSNFKSVDRSIQTVVSCLFNPENSRLRNSVVTQDDYFKESEVGILQLSDI
ncbi:hypothetical protein P7K49_031542 [Saguinus oedipus]|uniref:RRM domain-containing protein n=1 Tax=Saguinus oedipus TaxID=9490 RepID=A0ABQ9TZP9_SAGOE|nr:hypothetical protein P7K49_031542 [Saguinus oedipus]